MPTAFLKPLVVALGRLMPLALLSVALPSAASVTSEPLTLERLFSAPELAGGTLRSVRFSPDGQLITWLQGAADDKDRLDLWAYDLKVGQAARLVDARALVPQEQALSVEEAARRERQRTAALRGIVDYSFAEDSQRLLFPLGGDLYLYDLRAPAATTLRRLTRTAAYETDARFSPRGHFVSFIRDQDLWVIELATGTERAITVGGGGLVSHGMAEFIAQEELGRQTGYWWSPDDSYLAYTRVDETGVSEVERSEILAAGVRTVKQRYPATGQPNALVELYVTALAGGAAVKVDLGAETDIYLARVNWQLDSRQLLVQRLSRDQQRLDLLRSTPTDGRSTGVLSETSTTWVELHDLLRPLADGSFLWASVRVWFVGSREGHTERQLYSAQLDGRDADAPARLTPEPGWHAIQMSLDAHAVLDTWSSVNQPPRTVLRLATGGETAALVPNLLDDQHPYAPYRATHPQYEFGTLPAADGQRLHWQLVKPHDFDPARQYPVVVQVYGGPHGQQVMNAWDDGFANYLALNLLFRAPGVFAAGVSGAPITDWSLYDTAYTERYLGTPQGNAAGYATSSALGVATQLADPLLVLHGMADDNVLFEHSTRLFKVLQEAGKPFEVMVYPGHKHGLLRQSSVGPHAYHTMARFLERYLRPSGGAAAAAP